VRRIRTVLVLALAAVGFAQPAEAAPRTTPDRALTPWTEKIDAIIGDRPFSVVVGENAEVWYGHLGRVKRPPASNEKLILSMALLAWFGPDRVITTEVRTDGQIVDGVVHGNLWVVGHGDPETGPGQLKQLAAAVQAAGILRVRGRVIGGIGAFARDWFAPGWKDYFPAEYIPLPTALTFRTNTSAGGVHITDPEHRLATAFTDRLEAAGIPVRRKPDARSLVSGLEPVVSIGSPPMSRLLRHMNVWSRNFWAEVLGKYLGFARFGKGTIASGARATCAFTNHRGQDFDCNDGSGLSYDNRVTARGIVELLWVADGTTWGSVLQASLPAAGRGTLEGRLDGIVIRAKTGTLIDVSALSGWIWTDQGDIVEFSILSSGIDDDIAKRVEDRIVTIIANRAVDPTPEPTP
jgi:D-alanyl-D-alanine carboxypeptidase/D-alanyl-D-alanine-endopeptidase (penicillin-binding protein 4)